jgi:hypothetical protein
MNDVFNEVDEEVRRDKAVAFFNKHGSKIVGLAIAIVMAVGGWRFYQDRVFRERAALGARFEAALVDVNAGKIEALTTLAEDKSGGTYPALAKFRLASELARTAKDDAGVKNAVSAFDTLANDATLPAEWREMAKIRAAYAMLETAPFEAMESRLAPLATPANTYRNTAREALALAAWRAGHAEKALDALQAIILDADAPSGLRQRAEVLLAVVRAGAKAN